MTYSEQRKAKAEAAAARYQSLKDKLTNGSLCCHATIRTVYQPLAMENEVRTIRVCNGCNSEAPNLDLFDEWAKVPKFFIDLHTHKTNN